MIPLRVSVIIPTFNRLQLLEQTLVHLRKQSLSTAEYELIVVDDGSTPPVTLPPADSGPASTLIRFDEILERCVARNHGAEIARGEILVFLDDDLEVGPGFLAAHVEAQKEWPEAVAGGCVLLPRGALDQPFVRFRQEFELASQPTARGPMQNPGAAAGNFSMRRDAYRRLGGFDAAMVGVEDLDFSYRHIAAGGTIVFLPEAVAIHWDHALSIYPYCRRTEFAAECMVPLVRRYPHWPVNRERDEVNGPARWGREPLGRSLVKILKSFLAFPPVLASCFAVTWLLERVLPRSKLLRRSYQLLIGIYFQRGYRKGLKRTSPAVGDGAAPAQPVPAGPAFSAVTAAPTVPEHKHGN